MMTHMPHYAIGAPFINREGGGVDITRVVKWVQVARKRKEEGAVGEEGNSGGQWAVWHTPLR